jgi:hypothetical protein
VAVAAARANLDSSLRAALQQRGAHAGRERVLEDPVTAQRVAGSEKNVHSSPSPSGWQEVQVVEADQRAERDRRIDGAAHGDADDAAHPLLGQRRDVRPVGDEARQPRVPGLVARDVQHVDAGDLTRDTSASPQRVLTG